MSLRISLGFVSIWVVLAQEPHETAKARFHHLHLNTTDPAAAVKFYVTKFEAERRSYGGSDAVWANHSWLLFEQVSAPPKADITSGIWHMGWGGGAEMKETFRRQVESGTRFQAPLVDLSDQCDGKGGNEKFFFAYVEGPDRALIELNTTAAGDFKFGHVHLLSSDPVGTGEWYMKHFGLARRGEGPVSREARFRCGRQTGPAFSMMMDDVNVIVYPIEWSQTAFPALWKDRRSLESSAGHVIDHLGFEVDDVDATLLRLKADGVVILEGARTRGGMRSAMIEGPDQVRIELVQSGR